MSGQVVPPQVSPWARIGPALTARNVWLWVAVFMVAMTNFSTLPGDVRIPALNLAGGLLASAAMLLTVWLAWRTFLRFMTGASRVAVAVAVTAVAGMVRGGTYQWLLVEWSMSEPGSQGYVYRLFGGVVMAVAGALTGSLVKVNVEAHRVRLEQLDALQEQLSQVLASSDANLRAEQDTALKHIVRDLTYRLDDVSSSNAALAAASLEQLTSEIVRPLSHELAANAPVWHPPDPSLVARKLDWSKVWATMASPATINPLVPAIMILVVIPSSAVHMGIWASLLMHLLAAGLVYFGLSLLRHTAGNVARHQPTVIRMVVTLVLIGIACVPAGVMLWLIAPDGSGMVSAMYALVITPLVALLFSFIRAAGQQQRQADEQVAELVNQTRWWITRTGMVRWWQNAALARALHGPVQSAIHVAVRRLRVEAGASGMDSAVTHAVLTDVSTTLSEIVMKGERRAPLREELADLQTVWHPLVDVKTDCSEVVSTSIDTDPVCAEIAIDILSEALSNAVRHGGARRVQVIADIDWPNVLMLIVVDDGIGQSTAGEVGLGTAQLQACALNWSYVTEPCHNRLRVSLPWLRPEGDTPTRAVSGTP